jgi:hypothetical protein
LDLLKEGLASPAVILYTPVLLDTNRSPTLTFHSTPKIGIIPPFELFSMFAIASALPEVLPTEALIGLEVFNESLPFLHTPLCGLLVLRGGRASQASFVGFEYGCSLCDLFILL